MTLNQSIQNYDNSLEKSKTIYSGLLGLAIGGSRKVNIETRAGYVYVRLRDNLSEVIQAYNDKVSPVYDFPVLLERRGNKWYITGRDDARYETFGTAAPFLPAHGDSHSFNRDGGGGGDAVFIYPDQFVPLLVYPSGTFGAGNLMVAPYALQRANDFIYVGNTGTGNLLIYKPTNAQAIVGLVYLDKTTGNPGVLIASGTPMSGTPTGTAAVLPYLPYPSSNQEPLYAFRLVSGTTSLNWNNLYNVRQFYGGSPSTGTSGGGISGIVVQDEGVTQGTGTVLNFVGDNVSVTVSGAVARVFVTGSAGSSLPSFITGSVPFAGSDGILKENNERLNFDEINGTLWAGRKPPINLAFGDFRFFARQTGTNAGVAYGGIAFGTGSSGSPSAVYNGYRARGTEEVPLPVQMGDALLTYIGNGFDGDVWQNATRFRFYANGDWITGTYLPTRAEIEIVPSGSATRRTQLYIYGDNVNQPTGSTYNVGGRQHTHAEADITDGSWQLIEDKYLSGADAANFDFTSIPSTYKHLKIMFQARSDRASPSISDKVILKFNNDAGNNYLSHVQWGDPTPGSEEQTAAGAPYHITYINAAGSPAGWFSNTEITLFDYANANIYKNFQARGSQMSATGAGNFFVYDATGIYQSNTAISRITLYPNIGANFKQYSRATLFGMR